MLQHLSNPEYLHVLLNPLPVYGLAVGALGLIVALLLRQRAARLTALAIIFATALSAWPAHHYGERAYDRVFAMADNDGGRWLNEHRERAEKFTYIFYLVAALALLTAAAEWKMPRAAVPLAALTLLLAVTSVGIGGHIATAGGRVRHREFRYVPLPEPQKDRPHER